MKSPPPTLTPRNAGPSVSKFLEQAVPMELATEEQRAQLAKVAYERHWGPALLLVGWLHLFVFTFCYYLTIVKDYHDSTGYLFVWIGEVLGAWLIFRVCGGARRADSAPAPLELYLRRVWITYFILAFNLGSMNTLRGHRFFEFFPAIASLASFAFIMLAIVVQRKFFIAMLVMFGSGLLMAAFMPHAYLIFALAWWLVLQGVGITLWQGHRTGGTSGAT